MKKLSKIILATIFIPFSVFGAGNIEISATNTSPKIGEIFSIEVKIASDEKISDIKIPGIENFDIFSDSQMENVQIFGKERMIINSIALQLSPKKEGTFEIGPVSGKDKDGELFSEILKINIGINSNIKTLGQELPSKEKKEELKKIEGLQKPEKKFSYISFFIVIFLGFFYFIISKFFLHKKEEPKIQTLEKQIEEQILSHKERLLSLEEEIEFLSKSDFYEKLHDIIREFFGEKFNIKKTKSFTLKDITPYLKKNPKLLSLFKKSYKKEFDESKENQKDRKNIIGEYKKHL